MHEYNGTFSDLVANSQDFSSNPVVSLTLEVFLYT